MIVIIGLGNGLAPLWCQAIAWMNDDILSTKKFNEIWIKAQLFVGMNSINRCRLLPSAMIVPYSLCLCSLLYGRIDRSIDPLCQPQLAEIP